MCLYIRGKGSKKKAEKDIVCYKILALDENGHLCSRYKSYFMWIVDKTYRADNAWTGSIKAGEVKEGYFHSYTYNPLYNPKQVDVLLVQNLVVYECIIPAGTYYYKGRHSDGVEGYASKSLKLIKRLYQ